MGVRRKLKRRGRVEQRIYMDAEFPHLTEDEADVMVAKQRMNDAERPFEDYLLSRGFVVVNGKAVKIK